jgi:hypothetical protein
MEMGSSRRRPADGGYVRFSVTFRPRVLSRLDRYVEHDKQDRGRSAILSEMVENYLDAIEAGNPVGHSPSSDAAKDLSVLRTNVESSYGIQESASDYGDKENRKAGRKTDGRNARRHR